MKHNFEERKENRIKYAQEQASKNEAESNAQFKRSDDLASVIPFGQPILVGHHSERSHRAQIKKIHRAMDKSVEASQKAKYYTNRAQAIEENTSIFSDDPNALDKLKEKLKSMEEYQELMKETNKVIRKNIKKPLEEQVKALLDMGFSEVRAYKIIGPDFAGRIGYASYMITNNGANMRRVKQRIEELEKLATMVTTETDLPDGVKLVSNVEANRLQILFPGKPDEKIREALKYRGFRWAPSEQAWQRHLNTSNVEYFTKWLTDLLTPKTN